MCGVNFCFSVFVLPYDSSSFRVVIRKVTFCAYFIPIDCVRVFGWGLCGGFVCILFCIVVDRRIFVLLRHIVMLGLQFRRDVLYYGIPFLVTCFLGVYLDIVLSQYGQFTRPRLCV